MMNNTVALRKQLHNVFLIVDDEYEMRAAPDNVKKQAEKEVKLLSQLNHANIVKYRESFIGEYELLLGMTHKFSYGCLTYHVIIIVIIPTKQKKLLYM